MMVLAQAADVAGQANTAEIILFSVFSVIAIGAAIAVITMRNIVHAGLMLVINMLAIAGLYLTLQSGFLSVIQIIVYAGAIMVLFLFVIMLLGVDRDDDLVERRLPVRIMAGLGTVTIAGILLYGFAGTYTSADSRCGDQAPVEVTDTTAVPCIGMDQALATTEAGAVGVVAETLFTRYTFPFEVAALLLTVATIGAMMLGRRVDLDDEEDPAYEPSGTIPGPADRAAIAAAAAQRRDGPDPLDELPDEFVWDDADAVTTTVTDREILSGADPHPVVTGERPDPNDPPDPRQVEEASELLDPDDVDAPKGDD